MKAPGGSREVVGVTRVPGPDPGGGTGCPGDEERTERGDEERTEEKGAGGKEQEGDVGRDMCW